MSKTARPRKYWYFVYPVVFLFFSSLSILFVLSAKGYVLNYKSGKLSIEKTGMIIVSSRPNDAKIYINDRYVNKRTLPFFNIKLDRLASGFYKLRVEKDNFFAWEKILEVFPETVTWANHILLFSKDPQIEEVNFKDGIEQILNSEDHKFSVVYTGLPANKLLLFNHASGEISELADFSETNIKKAEIKSISPDRKNVLFLDKTSEVSILYNLEIDSKKFEKVFLEGQESYDKIFFDTQNNHTLYVLKKGNLQRLNLRTHEMSSQIEQNVVFAVTKGKKLYYIKENGLNLSLLSLEGSNKESISSAIPKSADYSFEVSSKEQKIAFTATPQRTLYLIEKNQDSYVLKEITDNVDSFGWSGNGDKFFYSELDNLYVSDFLNKKDYMVGTSKEFADISWYGQDHLLSIKNGEPTVMDYDGKNRIVLSASKTNDLFFSADTENIIFQGVKDPKLFIYKVEY